MQGVGSKGSAAGFAVLIGPSLKDVQVVAALVRSVGVRTDSQDTTRVAGKV